jgi:hypothetical protein
VWAGMYHIYEEHIMTGNQVYMIVRIFAKVYHFFLNGWEKICSRNRKKLVSVFFSFFLFFFFLNSENFFVELHFQNCFSR